MDCYGLFTELQRARAALAAFDCNMRGMCRRHSMQHPRFKISIIRRDQHTFSLTTPNGETLLQASERYGSRACLERAIASVRESARLEHRYDRRESQEGRHYFVLRAANGEVIGVSEMYASEAMMEKQIESLRAGAARALIYV
jgi:uncharacterized protein YegP (UPF0339 family)